MIAVSPSQYNLKENRAPNVTEFAIYIRDLLHCISMQQSQGLSTDFTTLGSAGSWLWLLTPRSLLQFSWGYAAASDKGTDYLYNQMNQGHIRSVGQRDD